ncbi:CGNR zinc finger domain-containing protein [Kitasatospora sp. NPDC017646]|uniref:CGNR zinc finger domain-containing protein n=1 Tax=Kitasatospora sp. NPDC017646 TaxID=3364024 RepID=UPI0037B5B9F7
MAQALAAPAGDRVPPGRGSAVLRACPGPGCVRFFVKDHPRRGWCGPGCGNRARAGRPARSTGSSGTADGPTARAMPARSAPGRPEGRCGA